MFGHGINKQMALTLACWVIFKKSSQTLSKCQIDWIQIRNDVLSVLICVQTVCIGYQLIIKVAINNYQGKSSEGHSVKMVLFYFNNSDLGPYFLQRLSADLKSHR